MAEVAAGLPDRRYEAAVEKLNTTKDLKELYSLSNEPDTQTIMKLHATRCNGHAVGESLIAKRLSCRHGNTGVDPDEKPFPVDTL